MILRRKPPSKGKLLGSITMRSCEYYIDDRMIESCSAVFHTKRHIKHWGKITTVCAKLSNLDLNLETGSKDLAIIG